MNQTRKPMNSPCQRELSHPVWKVLWPWSTLSPPSSIYYICPPCWNGGEKTVKQCRVLKTEVPSWVIQAHQCCQPQLWWRDFSRVCKDARRHCQWKVGNNKMNTIYFYKVNDFKICYQYYIPNLCDTSVRFICFKKVKTFFMAEHMKPASISIPTAQHLLRASTPLLVSLWWRGLRQEYSA